jgi:outer membrane protein TolC
MRRKNKSIVFILSFLVAHFSYGIHKDSTNFHTLSAEEFLKIVKTYHPVARLTQLDIDIRQAQIISARGAFDPILSYQMGEKVLDNKEYYSYSSPMIKIPTWFGMEFQAGMDNLSGNNTDPTETFGQSHFIGISVPLGKNLLMDKRRAALKQAKILSEMAVVEQQNEINNLLMEAMESYWNWVKQYEIYQIIKQNVAVNNVRFELIKKGFENGERPAIDTIEALTQLQTFQNLEIQQKMLFQNATLLLSVYLWSQNQTPYTLPAHVVPQKGWEAESRIQKANVALSPLLDAGLVSHPELMIYEKKYDFLKVERKLKFQELLPKVDLNYDLIGKSDQFGKTLNNANWMGNNYRFGLKVDVPLRLSLGRGEYQQANLKLNAVAINKNQKAWQIETKIKSYFNEYIALQKMIGIQSQNTANYQMLVNAEEKRLENGESSIFLINQRESKWLESQEKLIDLKCKFYKNIYALQWSAGILR